jgi:hypothetical protein
LIDTGSVCRQPALKARAVVSKSVLELMSAPGQRQPSANVRYTSALPSNPDIVVGCCDVALVPQADIGPQPLICDLALPQESKSASMKRLSLKIGTAGAARLSYN